MKKTLGFLAILLLAGCADDPTPSGEEAPEERAGLGAPTWSVGDYWTFDTPNGKQSIVVTNATSDEYFLDTDDEGSAYGHARSIMEGFGGYSTLGEIRVTDLAATQGEDRILYFQWPLVDGATWQTPWDGETFTINATRTSDNEFSLQAHDQNGTLRVAYNYMPEVKWFSQISFYNGTGGQYWDASLDRSGTGFTGDLVRYEDMEILYESNGSIQDSRTLVSGNSFTHLRIQIEATCASTGQFEYTLGRIDNANPASYLYANDAMAEAMACPNSLSVLEMIENDATQWRQNVAMIGDNLEPDVDIEVLQMQRFIVTL